jgi:HSP20 family protein
LEAVNLSWDEFSEWWKRRRFPFPGFGRWFYEGFEDMMKEIDRMMEDLFKGFKNIPEDMIRERKLPDGRTIREIGPMVYGYSVTIGPDGKPVIREFGNIKPSARPKLGGLGPGLDIKTEREPLVDVISDDGNIKVIAELPGVEKTDIKLHATSNTLTIHVDNPQRKYFKELELPEEVDPKTAKSTYRNGVLEVTLAKKEKKKPKGEPIAIE